MRILLLRSLALLAAVALFSPAASAQDVVVDTLFSFEGDDGMGDVEGWEITQDATGNTGDDNSSLATIKEKAIGMGNFIPAFHGEYLLEAIPNRPLLARDFRGAKYTWATPQDWTNRATIRLAASMNARNIDAERHEYRIRVISGTGANADTTEKVFEGLKSEEFDTVDNNTFVNEWEVLTFDLATEGDPGFDLTQITQIEAAGRNVDDGTENSPNTGNPTPGPDGNWGGNVHVDLVTIEGPAGVAVEDTPGLASLGEVYPNPTASGASLAVEVEVAQRVRMAVYDVLGREVTTAFEGTLAPGTTALLRIGVSDLAPGRYVVRLQGETFTASRTLSVVR